MAEDGVTSRRDQILEAAARLFNRHGYHATSMSDIGAAVGITGPGLYRHFRNKEEILETVLVEAGERIRARVDRVMAEAAPHQALDLLIDNYAQSVVEVPALSITVMRERRVLGDQIGAWISRNLRLHTQEWVTALMHARPDLTEAEARILVQAAFSLTHAVDRWSDVEPDRLAALLAGMIRAAVWAPRPTSADVDALRAT